MGKNLLEGTKFTGSDISSKRTDCKDNIPTNTANTVGDHANADPLHVSKRVSV